MRGGAHPLAVATRIRAGTCAIAFIASTFGPSKAGDGCGHIDTRSGPVGYCIKEADRIANPDVVYYFHGAGPDGAEMLETTFADGVPELTRRWRNLRLAAPTIIGISWGPKWTLKGTRLEAFQHEIIPRVESKLGRPVGRRMVAGLSIGGLSAFLAWSRMPELFDRAVFQCAAFPSYNPFATRLSKLRRADRLSHGDRALREHYLGVMAVLADVFKKDFSSSSAEWARWQPPSIMKTIDSKNLPPAYIVYNSRDEFGFGPGLEIAAARELVEGRHCEGVMTDGVARFLSNAPVR